MAALWRLAGNIRMTMFLTAVFLLLLASAVSIRVFLANRRAAREAETKAAALRERERKELELRELVEKAKKKDYLAAVASAAGEDPKRAARTLGKMMRRRD